MDSTMQTKLANVQEIPEGKSIVVKGPDGQEIALYKWEGEIFALINTCLHMGGPLGEGEVENAIVTCPWHGWQFDIRSGACENMPGEEARCVQIQVVKDEIFLLGNSL